MPAKYARYFIKIIAVRCERLQDISDEDCLKEGIKINEDAEIIGYPFGIKFPYYFEGGSNWQLPREAYAALTDKINGKGMWDGNPFVWMYDYELV
jgi:hypothetical protein